MLLEASKGHNHLYWILYYVLTLTFEPTEISILEKHCSKGPGIDLCYLFLCYKSLDGFMPFSSLANSEPLDGKGAIAS